MPLLYNMAASGKTPDLPADELGKLGFKLAIYPNWIILAAIPAMQSMLRDLKGGGIESHARQSGDVQGVHRDRRPAEIQKLEERYGVPEDQRASL